MSVVKISYPEFDALVIYTEWILSLTAMFWRVAISSFSPATSNPLSEVFAALAGPVLSVFLATFFLFALIN
jgi:uncharacterized protein YggT (Ycf19 family)